MRHASLLAIAIALLFGAGRATAGRADDNAPYGNAIVLDARTGARDARFPVLSGTGAAVADGSGGFYVAAAIADFPAGAIRHVRADGSVDPHLRVVITGTVPAALARSGGTLYLGGTFSGVGGLARRGMAAIDLRDGSVLPWAPAFRTEPGGARGALTLALAGGNVIAGGVGNVTAYGGRTGRKRWSLDVDLAHDRSVPALNGAVDSQVVVGGGRLFVAGAFDRIRAAPAGRWIHIGARAAPAELDPRTGRVLPWRAARSLGDEIVSLAAYRNTLFVAGHGSGYRVSLKSGQVLGPIRGRPTAVAASGGILYLGGNLYDRLNIPNRNNLAAMDLGTGRVTAFAPRLTKFQSPGKIVVSGGHVLAVGEFVKSLG
jgi:hypothetical protein